MFREKEGRKEGKKRKKIEGNFLSRDINSQATIGVLRFTKVSSHGFRSQLSPPRYQLDFPPFTKGAL
ncbi:hypothetical protein E2C01_042432 [Portunus trituberculatus]|uniref:Uncharacterized protein n=1 Tax=Portunus trituberculatus TaxID=210409 RepID=A0A5B7FMF0_PORTR|nr:hypothetical protein [Portunus trituberculatus]